MHSGLQKKIRDHIKRMAMYVGTPSNATQNKPNAVGADLPAGHCLRIVLVPRTRTSCCTQLTRMTVAGHPTNQLMQECTKP